MKTRIIQTRFYDDEFVSECDLYTQHLYLYLLTCQYINICGIFQLSDAKIKFESKLTDLQFQNAKSNLQQADKVIFKDGWVCVKNARKNNNYEKSPLNLIACENELLKVPNHIISFLDSSIDSTMYSTQKPEIRNQKQEIRKKGGVGGKSFVLSDEQLKELKEKFPNKDVDAKYEELQDYCASKGKVYKDYMAFVRNCLRKTPDTIKNNSPAYAILLNGEQVETKEEFEQLAKDKKIIFNEGAKKWQRV